MSRVAMRARFVLRKPTMLGVRPLGNGMYFRKFGNHSPLPPASASGDEGANVVKPISKVAKETNDNEKQDSSNPGEQGINGDESTSKEAKESQDSENKGNSNHRDPPKSQSLWEWLSSKQIAALSVFKGVLGVAGVVGAGCVYVLPSLATMYAGHVQKPETTVQQMQAERKETEEIRKQSFAIETTRALRYPFERKVKEDAWHKFIYDRLLLDGGTFTWICGPKRVGKSTLLQANTFRLQNELKNGNVSNGAKKYHWLTQNGASKFEVFYINLETTADDDEVAKPYIRELRAQILANARNGQCSLVVVDSVGAMFRSKEGEQDDPSKWDENMSEKEFKKRVGRVPGWVTGFFAFVKGMTDTHSASFVFVTSKPMHHVIELSMIKHYTFGNVIKIDIEEAPYNEFLSLDLTKEEFGEFAKQILPNASDATVGKFKTALMDCLKAENLEMKRIGHCATAIGKLKTQPEWNAELEKA